MAFQNQRSAPFQPVRSRSREGRLGGTHIRASSVDGNRRPVPSSFMNALHLHDQLIFVEATVLLPTIASAPTTSLQQRTDHTVAPGAHR